MKTLLQTAFLSLVAHTGTASVMLAPGTVLPGQAYIDKGAEYADRVVAVRRVSPSTGAVSYATGIKLTPYHVLLPAHVIDSLTGFRSPEKLKVLIGPNFFSAQQTLDVASYVTHPTYISGSNSVGGSVYDMAVLKTSTAMPAPFASLAAISPPNGTTITYAGYGMPGLSSASAVSHDGRLRAFQGTTITPSAFFPDSIWGGTYSSDGGGLALPGSVSQGDSGAAGFLSNNQIAFMATSGNGDNYTYGIDLTTTAAREFITANTAISDPPRLAIDLVAQSAQLSLSNLLSGTEYRVMRSPTLSGWEEAHRFTATTATYSWGEALSPIGRTFYRLEWNE